MASGPHPGSRRWRAMGLALVIAAPLAWWAGQGDEPEAIPPEPEAVSPAPAAPRPPEQALAAPVPAAALSVFQDAGRLAQKPVDAGPSEQQRIDETMRRWAAALAPLFKYTSRRSAAPAPVPVPVIAVSGEARSTAAPAPVPDCEAGVQRLPLRLGGSLDVVIAIDTSGSMIGEFKDVVRWISGLELLLRDRGVDFQLLVVADHRAFTRFRAPLVLDGGQLQAQIGSTDALETLITAARAGPAPRWTQLLRPGSTRHVVIVTDDEARDARGLPYLGPLISAADGALGTPENPSFALHLLGGFASPGTEGVLSSEQPLATRRCPDGVEPGLAYQRLAQVTGGLRASLCQPASHKALSEGLADWAINHIPSPCVWLLPHGSAAVDARAVGRESILLRLSEARSAEACVSRRDTWLASGQVFALCGGTCGILTDAGYDFVEVSTRCVP